MDIFDNDVDVGGAGVETGKDVGVEKNLRLGRRTGLSTTERRRGSRRNVQSRTIKTCEGPDNE